MMMEFGTEEGCPPITLKVGNGFIQFYDDNDTTEVSFPDKEVRIVKDKQ